jgi:hypothetical protein
MAATLFLEAWLLMWECFRGKAMAFVGTGFDAHGNVKFFGD